MIKISENGDDTSTKTIYFDESGFTGYNYLDKSQPYFIIASTDIDPVIAENFLKDFFPHYKGSEFKFSNIWKNNNNKRRLVNFNREFSKVQGHSFVFVTDKRFAVLIKIVDFLIEPIITASGHDFYAEGFPKKFVNYIHFRLVYRTDPQIYNVLINNYQSFSRNPSDESLKKFQIQLSIMASSVNDQVGEFLKQMKSGADNFLRFNDLERFKETNDLQLTTMHAIVCHWRQKFSDDFFIVHDETSNFSRKRKLWENVTNSNVPEQQHILGDGTIVEYPLRVVSTKAVDSKDNYSVQLCDVLAGLTAKLFSSNLTTQEEKLINSIKEPFLNSLSYNRILPDNIFPDNFEPKKLKGSDNIDKMTEIIFGSHND